MCKSYSLLFGWLLLSSLHANAIEETYINELKGSQVSAGNFFTVSDEKFNNSGSWSLISQHISVNNLITFEINYDSTIYFYSTPFTRTINFKIYLYGNQADTSLITDSTTYSNITLTVNYDTVTGKPYKGIALYKFNGSHKYKVKILSISSPGAGPISTDIFRLKGQIFIDRKYTFNDNSTDVTRFTVVNTNQLSLQWTPSNYPGAEMFDLEYTYIDGNSQIAASITSYLSGIDYNVPVDSLSKWFINNSSRITTAASHYLLNIPYDSGFILFRIRGVQINYPDNVRWEGNWNYYARPSSSSACTPPSCPRGVVLFDGHEKNLNWQFSISFAEEGKRKEVISYFDGSLRNRQSVTLSNTDNRNIVQETIYDALGRPAASILPAPAFDSTIHYFRGFNRNSGGTNPYGFTDLSYANCGTTADSVSHASGTGKYYSTSNPFQDNYYYSKYVPNANGYPLAVTEYMADNTGRIKTQGGVGAAFQLNSGHETKYYYGKPAQAELDRMFGAEAGNASHYLKSMVVDPNGQTSVSYLDASGKTVATALAGASPSNIHPLSSQGTTLEITDILIRPTDFIRDATNHSLSGTTTFLVPQSGLYDFSYEMASVRFDKLFGSNKDSLLCSSCYYDLELIIKNNCDSILLRDTLAAGAVFDTTCTTTTISGGSAITISQIGEYYIHFNLRISQDALAYFDSVHLVKNSDIKKINYFLLEELKNSDFYGCYSDCNTCIDKLGTKPDFVNLFKSLYAADSLAYYSADSLWTVALYDSLYANCQAMQATCNTGNVCDEKLTLLKIDVSPGGQYALYDSAYTLQEVPINVLAQRNSLAWFPDENGHRDSVTLYDTGGLDSIKLDVKQLNDSFFIKNWKPSWADSLVKLHPEYCYYLWCVANAASFEFDKNIENWVDGDSVMAKGWFYPPVYDTILTHDPFFLYGGNGYSLRNKMRDSLRLFSRTLIRFGDKDKNILEVIDLMLYCKNQEDCNSWNTCSPDNDCRSRSREWSLYKQYYLNLKQQFYEEARRTSGNPVFANCTNCFIGSEVGSGVLNCSEPDDFSFVCTGYGLQDCRIIYKNGQWPGVQRKTFVTVRTTSTPPGYSFNDLIVFNPGDTVHFRNYEGYTIDSIISVSCDTSTVSWEPFDPASCNTGLTCDYGVFNPYDRDSISFYIIDGNPNTPPSGVPSGYAGCQFYNVFTLHTGPSTYCRFLNVWVCIKDSTCPGGTGVCYEESYPSTCTAEGADSLYKYKVRRYPAYVNPADYVNSLLDDNPQQVSEVNEQLILDDCKSNCEAQADVWINTLSRCTTNPSTLASLKAYLIDICSKGCSLERPFGASSIPLSISATYHSFEEAIAAIIGSVSDSCTTELLSHPYPYDRQPIFTDRVISETDSAICAEISAKYSTYTGSGFSGSFHKYLSTTYGNTYRLDSLELDDLINACEECNHLLKNDITLPLIFDPLSGNCVNCDSTSAALSAFNAKFSGITEQDEDYEILFTNYFNHRFGFALTYTHYRSFLDSCTAYSGSYTVPLCNEPVSSDEEADENSCIKDIFITAITNANYTYIAYIDSIRNDFREAWLTKCMNAQPELSMESTIREYHYTLYYYDQSGNLVKTIPPEGVSLLSKSDIETLQAARSGINPHCSNSNAILFTNGSVNFPGGTSNAPQLNVGADPFTIECWINLSSLSNQGILSNNHYSGSYNHGYSLSINSNKLSIHMGENNSSYKVEAVSPTLSGFISLNTWSHIAVQRTGIGTVKMFINGNELPVTYTYNSPNTGNLNHGSTDNFYVGASNKDGSVSKLSTGKLRHVRVYQRALPAAEVRQNYMDYCGNPSNQSGMVFWETLNEGSWTSSGGNDYVYDRIYNAAGQKSGTVAFEISGVSTLVPAHRLATTYHYNSLNQVVQQFSPDGDTSWFFYDRLGRLTASQNKEQKDNSSYSGSAGRFSYTKYDSLGRIIEVGEKSSVTNIRTINMLKADSVSYWLGLGTNKQLTKTIYDNPVNTNIQDYNTSRKRVVASIYLENSSDTEGDSTLYNYDILGNVKLLLQHVKTLVAADPTNGRKKVDYAYDLVSGKVNLVSYQHGKRDQFYYKYNYDADNRLTRSYSSRDKLLWQEDASYQYYLHGPLARTELGQNKVQGVDYAYTLQGWLKGINSDSLSHFYDISNDGRQGATYARMSRDVYAFKLGYYTNDYIPVGGASAAAFSIKTYTSPGSLESSGNRLFNGNISYTTLALSKLNTTATSGYSYGYDQLNRLTEMRQHTTNTTGGWNNSTLITAYRESVSYDANGNILQYLRKGTAATPHMDSLSYKYNRDGSGYLTNNRLIQVKDSIPAGNYSMDIDNQSNSNNYRYDKIGNLVLDVAENIDEIRWNVYGKIKSIFKEGGYKAITYGYDAGGNRTYKEFVNLIDKEAGLVDSTRTWYIRDAQGNVLAIYQRGTIFTGDEREPVIPGELIWKEQHLYGSSRLGMWLPDSVLSANPPVVISTPIYDSLLIGSRNYELTNHLGNVLSTISDKKIGNDSSGVVNYYIAEVLSQNDYYPFGMLQPGRSYSAGTGYRYGFNGKENDNEVKGEGNQQDYGMRIYDPRLGKFLSVDPLTRSYPMLTPYQFASNSPISSIDLDGLEGLIATGGGQPFSNSSRPTGMILTVNEASNVIKGTVVSIFKAIFSEQLPKKLINNYAYGKGKEYTLNKTETVDLHVYKTGLHGGSENDIKKTADFLASIKKGESKSLPVGYSIQGGAGLAGTLGRFTIELQGTVTKDKNDDEKWRFSGKMRFVDTYDFKTDPATAGDLERNDWGDFQTKFADKYLDGTPFKITSEWIDVKQDQTDYFDWFNGKSDKDVPNKLGGSNSKETKEVKKTGTSSGEVKKQSN